MDFIHERWATYRGAMPKEAATRRKVYTMSFVLMHMAASVCELWHAKCPQRHTTYTAGMMFVVTEHHPFTHQSI